MPRTLNRLSPRTVTSLKGRGYYADGGGLYLQISALGTKSWVFRFARAGRQREMGLGPVHTVSLADAREKALECRKQLLSGVDPIDARKEAKASEVIAKVKTMTFDQCADAYVEANRAGWKSVKHADQWESTLKTYASPVIGNLPVTFVDTVCPAIAANSPPSKPFWTMVAFSCARCSCRSTRSTPTPESRPAKI